jgi:hypothetical protein
MRRPDLGFPRNGERGSGGSELRERVVGVWGSGGPSGEYGGGWGGELAGRPGPQWTDITGPCLVLIEFSWEYTVILFRRVSEISRLLRKYVSISKRHKFCFKINFVINI